MKKQHSFGFTLIELLVVIAIIGILAALVLVALGNARDKANDARVKADIGQLRTLAEIIYDSNSSSYGIDTDASSVEQCFDAPTTTTCVDTGTSSSVATLRADIFDANGGTNLTAESTAAAFCVEAVLLNATYVCADSTGVTENGYTTARCSAADDVICAS